MKTTNLLVGLAAGAAVGLLCAPQSGARNRAFLAKKTREGADHAGRSVSETAESMQRQGEQLKKNAAEGIDRLKTSAKEQIEIVLDAGKQAYNDAVCKI
jgi:gas vesicle protein